MKYVIDNEYDPLGLEPPVDGAVPNQTDYGDTYWTVQILDLNDMKKLVKKYGTITLQSHKITVHCKEPSKNPNRGIVYNVPNQGEGSVHGKRDFPGPTPTMVPVDTFAPTYPDDKEKKQ